MGLVHEIKILDAEKSELHLLTDEELKRIQSILVEMLIYIKEFCDKHDIPWGIVGGCALGAVRHQGFIPWDDDVDIAFTRKNFERFKAAFQKEHNIEYELICPGEQGYYSHIPRIFNCNTTAELIQNTGRGKGLFIDIFVLENAYDNALLRVLHGIQCTFYLFIISTVVTRIQKATLYKYGSANLRKKVKLRNFFGTFFSFKKPEYWIQAGIRCFSKVKDNDSKYVVSATGSGHYFGEIYPREWVCEFKEKTFENQQFPVIKELDCFLTKRYGKDYMIVPPIEKREKHAFVSLKLDT